MKQVWITKAGNADVLKVADAPDPRPAPGEVVIDVHRAGVNFADVMARLGLYPGAPPLPYVVGYEVSGVVREVNPAPRVGETPDTPGMPTFAPGDRVFALTRFGGYASVVSVPANQVFGMPHAMSFSEAAAILVNYFTAYLAVSRMGNLQPDERILIHNAGGGVGVAAVQLAKQIGARVIGTASGWKHERLRELGADELIDYRTTDWVDEIQRLTGGNGVHLVIDPIGGHNLKRDLGVLAPLGRLVGCGFSEPIRHGRRSTLRALVSILRTPRPPYLSLVNNNRSIGGLNLGHLWSEIDRLRSVGDRVLEAWQNGAARPVISAEVPIENAHEAHEILQERRNLGKVLLSVTPG